MAKLNFGFHTGSTGIGVPKTFYTELDKAGIPFFAKGSDSVPFDAQQIAQKSVVPHIVVYRRSLNNPNDPCPSGNPDVPDYNKPPDVAAQEHWAWHLRNLPPELDPQTTWLETINEVDKNRAEWLGAFAYATAQLALRDGYKWLAFGWSTGEPEYTDWSGPQMQKFLALVGQHPNRLGIAVHEYSLDVNDIENGAPYLVGRYKSLLEQNPNVNIYITEWGWTYNAVPPKNQAVQDILLIATKYYSRTPQVKGAAIWALNGGWGIADTVATYIEPLKKLTLDTVLPDPIEPPPPKHKAIVVKLPQESTFGADDWATTASKIYPYRHTMTASHDDMVTILRGGNAESYVKVVAPELSSQQASIQLIEQLGYSWVPLDIGNTPVFQPLYRPCDTTIITQTFGANPQYYQQFGLPGHDGLDYAVPQGAPFYAVDGGTVVHASDRRWQSNEPSNFGWHVVIAHNDGWHTVYAHATPNLPVAVDDVVTAGDVVGYSGNTGNSTGYHLHFGVLAPYDTGNGYPIWRFGQPVDPQPFVGNLPAPPNKTTIDLLDYMLADPTAWRVVRHPQGNQEDFLAYNYGNGQWAMQKNNPQHAEFWAYDTNHIYLTMDTSPAPASDGTDRFYVVTPGQWAKRYMAVGETFNDGGHTVQFYSKTTCQPHPENSGQATNQTTLVAIKQNYTFNTYGQNITLDEVIFIKGGVETQIFARHQGKALGRVGWQAPWGQSEIVELYFDRPPLNQPPQKYCGFIANSSEWEPQE